MVDAAFQLIPARSRSCWRGVACPPSIDEEQDEEEEAEEESQDREPHNAVPSLPSTLLSGSSTDEFNLLAQILANQQAMQRQMTSMETFHHQINHC